MRLASLVIVAGCAASAPRPPSFPDAPLELRDDTDRDQAIDEMWAAPAGAAREAIRARVADAIVRRIEDSLVDDKPVVAELLLSQLCSLWRDDATAIGKDLAAHTPLIQRLRAQFAKAGALEPAIATVVLLVELEPSHRDAHLAELDEILAFADELDAADEDGGRGARGQPIALLQPTTLALPLPWLVDRYVGLLEDRERAFNQTVGSATVPDALANEQPDVLETAHRIANVLARAGRTGEIHAHLDRLIGIYGADRELAARAEAVASQPTAAAFVDLAHVLDNDRDAADPEAALAACEHALARYPHDVALLAAAAGDAVELGRVDEPIALYEAALANDHASADPTLALELGRLYAARIARLASGDRPAAAQIAWRELATYASGRGVWQQVAAIGETSLGKGMLREGRVAEAEHELVASLDRAPSVDAYEALVTIQLKTDHLRSARRYASAGLALVAAETAADRYHRAKLARLAGEVARLSNKTHDASVFYLESMKAWASLGKDEDLPRAIAGERKLEFGRTMSLLGDLGKAVEMIEEAVDANPDSPATTTSAVALLLELGRDSDALDVLHRVLGTPAIGELYQVYACLWALADARHRGVAPDRLAVEYLASRHGSLWYEQLAEAATGRLAFGELANAATTTSRKVELAFYGATLALDPAATTPAQIKAKLREVVAAGMVMEAEYDLARQYAGEP